MQALKSINYTDMEGERPEGTLHYQVPPSGSRLISETAIDEDGAELVVILPMLRIEAASFLSDTAIDLFYETSQPPAGYRMPVETRSSDGLLSPAS